jgi:hypothetical protein
MAEDIVPEETTWDNIRDWISTNQSTSFYIFFLIFCLLYVCVAAFLLSYWKETDAERVRRYMREDSDRILKEQEEEEKRSKKNP